MVIPRLIESHAHIIFLSPEQNQTWALKIGVTTICNMGGVGDNFKRDSKTK